jgi:ABC-2 type transport system permease protein
VSDTLAYARYELRRTFRNRRLYILSLVFPLALYYAIAAPDRAEHSIGGTGIAAPVYFMVGLTAFGTMNAVVGCGARIAAERAVGWNRQLRLTPLSTRTYFRVKVLTAYVMAVLTIVLLYAAGATLGVRLAAADWLRMTDGLLRAARRGLVPGHARRHARGRRGAAFLLARAGGPRRARRPGLGRRRLGGRRGLDRRLRGAGPARVRARHAALSS